MRIGWIHKLVNKWPGKQTLGMYRFLPVFFLLGASLEFSMINWRVGEVNFYNTFKKDKRTILLKIKSRSIRHYKMPAGVTWGQYIAFTAAAAFSMLAGSQLVHQYYKPLKDLNDYINKELINLPPNVQEKIRQELQEEGVLN